MRKSVCCSSPFVALTTIASGSDERRSHAGDVTRPVRRGGHHDHLGAVEGGGHVGRHHEARRKPDVRQVHGIDLPHAHVSHQGRVASPEAGIVPHPRQVDGERRPPASGPEYRDALNDCPSG